MLTMMMAFYELIRTSGWSFVNKAIEIGLPLGARKVLHSQFVNASVTWGCKLSYINELLLMLPLMMMMMMK